jgi:hypothetical protein
LLKILGSGTALAVGGTAPSFAQQESDYWTLVAIPDTQFYAASDRLSAYARDQTEWIAENLDSENIRFVTHEGDMVDDGSATTQWDRIDEAMSTLDGLIPYSTLPGNHDWGVTNDKSSSIQNYTDYFGPARFDSRTWYGGAGPTSAGLNSYQLFSAGGYDFLHLALEWEPSGTVTDASTPLGWGQSILDEYSDHATILTTHSYLRDDGRRAETVQEVNGDGNSGNDVWQELIEPNPQIFLVLNGHYVEDDGEYHQVSPNIADLPVYELAANYQDRSNGGNGWFRLVQFYPGGGEDESDRIQVRTYSPSIDEYETDDDSEFSFDVDFDDRFTGFSENLEKRSFQQGTNGYEGSVDTNLIEAQPETTFTTAKTITIDTRDPQSTSNEAQALVRFDGIFGDSDDQIPTGVSVHRATLLVETVDGGDGAAVHRMLANWSDEDTWASTDGGIQADGDEAVTTPETETGAVSTGSTSIDVTESVQRWADGEPNHGWAFLPLGEDGWDFETSEGGTPPRLTVRYEACLSIPQAISDENGEIGNKEISRAKDLWREIEEVPGTCGKTISNEQISYLKDVWRTGGTVTDK